MQPISAKAPQETARVSGAGGGEDEKKPVTCPAAGGVVSDWESAAELAGIHD
jgi:hypothetical protein